MKTSEMKIVKHDIISFEANRQTFKYNISWLLA